MSKHVRVEALRKLNEQLQVETDPEKIVKITNSIARLAKKPRPAKPETPIKTQKGSSPIVAKWADRLNHVQPEAKRIECSLMCEFEERERQQRRTTGQTLTEGEKRTLMGELFDSLSAEEHAALNGGSREVA